MRLVKVYLLVEGRAGWLLDVGYVALMTTGNPTAEVPQEVAGWQLLQQLEILMYP